MTGFPLPPKHDQLYSSPPQEVKIVEMIKLLGLTNKLIIESGFENLAYPDIPSCLHMGLRPTKTSTVIQTITLLDCLYACMCIDIYTKNINLQICADIKYPIDLLTSTAVSSLHKDTSNQSTSLLT